MGKHFALYAIMKHVRQAAKLRELMKRPGIIRTVGAHDALSAKMIERAGFDAIWASGFGISASLKCIPDGSFLTMTEQLEVTKNIVEAVSIPVIADCDTGFGNALNVMRTVQEYEKAGIAGICIEDNVFPSAARSMPASAASWSPSTSTRVRSARPS